MCVSGLPIRNGLEHIREICNLSLELIDGLRLGDVLRLFLLKLQALTSLRFQTKIHIILLRELAGFIFDTTHNFMKGYIVPKAMQDMLPRIRWNFVF